MIQDQALVIKVLDVFRAPIEVDTGFGIPRLYSNIIFQVQCAVTKLLGGVSLFTVRLPLS